MDHAGRLALVLGLAIVLSVVGCQSPYHADRGALFGGLTGAGAGAIIGDAVGNAGAGTAIGAGLGALTGAAIGQEMDDIEAKNRAMIEQQLGRRIAAGSVTKDDVIAMTNAGVDDELIVNHVQAHGAAGPLSAADLIFLQQQGVSTRVIKAMQAPPPQPPVVSGPAPQPVIVEEHHYGSPYWGPPYYYRNYHRHRRPPPRVGWGISISN